MSNCAVKPRHAVQLAGQSFDLTIVVYARIAAYAAVRSQSKLGCRTSANHLIGDVRILTIKIYLAFARSGEC